MISSWRFLLKRLLTNPILTSRSDEPPLNFQLNPGQSHYYRSTVFKYIISNVYLAIVVDKNN